MLKFLFLFGQFKISFQFCSIKTEEKIMKSIKRYMCMMMWKCSAEDTIA